MTKKQRQKREKILRHSKKSTSTPPRQTEVIYKTIDATDTVEIIVLDDEFSNLKTSEEHIG